MYFCFIKTFYKLLKDIYNRNKTRYYQKYMRHEQKKQAKL